jgi:hypothetical protein
VSEQALPVGIESDLREITGATDRLIDAARAGDPEAVRAAIDRRDEAVRRFTSGLEELAGQEEAGAREQLAEAGRALAEQASRAETELRATMRRAKGDLQSFENSASAIRGYATTPSGASALDRSG